MMGVKYITSRVLSTMGFILWLDWCRPGDHLVSQQGLSPHFIKRSPNQEQITSNNRRSRDICKYPHRTAPGLCSTQIHDIVPLDMKSVGGDDCLFLVTPIAHQTFLSSPELPGIGIVHIVVQIERILMFWL